MDYEITSWKIPTDFHRLLSGLDTMVAILRKKPGEPTIYLYETDYKKVRRLATMNLPATAALDEITFRGIPVRNGGSKKSKRPTHYTEPNKRAR